MTNQEKIIESKLNEYFDKYPHLRILKFDALEKEIVEMQLDCMKTEALEFSYWAAWNGYRPQKDNPGNWYCLYKDTDTAITPNEVYEQYLLHTGALEGN